MKRLIFNVCMVLAAVIVHNDPLAAQETDGVTGIDPLIGQWRASIQFSSGSFAAVKDLEFMYVFNFGGTMTESSNYDAAPPVPPAYGMWRQTGDHRYELVYEFFVTRSPEAKEEVEAGSGWLPAGHGVLNEEITLSEDGRSFSSRIILQMYDQSGAKVPGGGEATGKGIRREFGK